MKRRDEVLVGIVATIAIGIAIVGSLFLARGGLLPGYVLYTTFDWGSGLRQGQPVMLSGVAVGYVDLVDIRRDGKLLVTMRVYNRYQVPKGTTAKPAPNGVFGDMMVAMTPSKPTDDFFAVGDTIPSGPGVVGIGDVLTKVDDLAADVRALTQALRKELVDDGGLKEIRKTIVNANGLIVELTRIADVQSAELTKTQHSLQRLANAVDSAQVDSTVRSLGELSRNVTMLTNDLRGTTNQLNGILTKLDKGDGTASQLLNDPGLYRDVRSLVQRLDSLSTDFQKNPRKYIKLSIF